MLGKLLRGGNKQAPPELPLTFSLSAERHLRIHQHYEPLRAWRFLSHHIRRYPQDLRAHTQRVLLAQHEPLLSRLAGSLQDAFLALGHAGVQLKTHLLRLVSDDLNETERNFFNQWLQDGSVGSQNQRWHEGSVLSSGQEAATLRLLEVERSQETARYSNVMEEVFACLEYGQVDTARELLEAEMLAGNTDESMEQELVNIYQYTRNRDGLNNMVRHMQETGRDIPALWLEKQQESEQW